MAFSTYDADHDLYDDINCVTLSRGGGGNWNNACSYQNLNGQHTSSGGGYHVMFWFYFDDNENTHTLKSSKMMFRRTS